MGEINKNTKIRVILKNNSLSNCWINTKNFIQQKFRDAANAVLTVKGLKYCY